MPLPFAPALMVIQAALLTAVHAHPADTVTLTDPVKPVAPALDEVAESDGVQATPACVMVKVLPPIVSVPVRDVLALFAATL